jgi:Fe-S cluster assembly protein SufB
VILKGDDSVGEFYSVALARGHQRADTGTKMIHLGQRTKSTIISKGISAAFGHNTYRGLVYIAPTAQGARNFTECDSLLLGSHCVAKTYPRLESSRADAKVEHEATTSKISQEQLFYLAQRGIDEEQAVSMIVNGFCKEVFKELPLEFAVEAQKLLQVSLEGSVG